MKLWAFLLCFICSLLSAQERKSILESVHKLKILDSYFYSLLIFDNQNIKKSRLAATSTALQNIEKLRAVNHRYLPISDCVKAAFVESIVDQYDNQYEAYVYAQHIMNQHNIYPLSMHRTLQKLIHQYEVIEQSRKNFKSVMHEFKRYYMLPRIALTLDIPLDEPEEQIDVSVVASPLISPCNAEQNNAKKMLPFNISFGSDEE